MSLPHSMMGRLEHFARQFPERQAIASIDVSLTYAQLVRGVQQQSELLTRQGIGKGAMVGIQCGDDIQYLLLCLALIRIGATSATVSSYEKEDVRKATIERCGMTYVVDNSHAIPLESLLSSDTNDSAKKPPLNKAPFNKADLDQEALVLFATSGTTGEPKLVMHQDSDLVAQAHRHVNSSEERFVCLASVEHNFAKRHRLYCFAVGATNVFINNDPASLVEQCLQLEVNVMHVSAFQAQGLLAIENIQQLCHIRLKLGGSNVPDSLRQKLRSRITPKLQAGYGTTETGAIGFTDPDDSLDADSVGCPLPGIEVNVVSPQRKALKQGETGELVIRCQGMFRGYRNNPKATESRLQDDWFYTGDIGYLDSQGRIHLSGRSDDMFVFNSMNIYPQDLESQISQHPCVIDVAVVPKPSEVHGNIPVALIVGAKDNPPDVSQLKLFTKKTLGIRSPRQFIVVDSIPRNAAGKIIRDNARLLSQQDDDIRELISNTLVANVGGHKIKTSHLNDFAVGKRDIVLKDVSLDSIIRMELLIELEIQYGVLISPEVFSQVDSFNGLVGVVTAQIKAQQHHRERDRQKNTYKIKPSTEHPCIIRLFQRTINFCVTVAQLRKITTLFEARLTPENIDILVDFHQNEALLSPENPEKFYEFITTWLQSLQQLLSYAGKQKPEPYSFRKVNPYVSLYSGPGEASEKTLIVGFCVAGGQSMMIPNAVLMQHSDATRYDFLILSEPLNQNYLKGIPSLGNSTIAICEWLVQQDFIKSYPQIRTMGCSAGGYPAVLAGYYLNADVALCISGRFHTERYLFKILKKIVTTWKTAKKQHPVNVIMSYASDNGRDRRYAKTIGKMTQARHLVIDWPGNHLGHSAFVRVAEMGLLGEYLERTLFAEAGQEWSGERFLLPEIS